MRSVILIAVLLSGCTHVSVQGSAGGGTTTTGAGVSVSYSGSGSAAMWALIGIGLIAAEYGGSRAARERGLEPEAKPVQPMDAGRKVNEVDCSKPIQDWSANLKCR
jgi:hypothetical protein